MELQRPDMEGAPQIVNGHIRTCIPTRYRPHTTRHYPTNPTEPCELSEFDEPCELCEFDEPYREPYQSHEPYLCPPPWGQASFLRVSEQV